MTVANEKQRELYTYIQSQLYEPPYFKVVYTVYSVIL